MHMIGHQHISVQRKAMRRECVTQAMAVVSEILIIQKCRGTIYIALGYVKRQSRQFESWAARHGKVLSKGALSMPAEPIIDSRKFPLDSIRNLWIQTYIPSGPFVSVLAQANR